MDKIFFGACIIMAFIFILILGTGAMEDSITSDCKNFGAFKAGGIVYECSERK